MDISAGSSEVVKRNIEPFVNCLVDLMVLITNLFGSGLFSQGLDLAGSAVLISPADVEDVVAHESGVPGVDVCGKDSPDDVSQVGLIVDVG